MARTQKIFTGRYRWWNRKELVAKYYFFDTEISAYPDISNVKLFKLQKSRQGVFAEAVAHAQSIVRGSGKEKSICKKT